MRPPNAEVIKKVLLHIPYVVVFYVVNNAPGCINIAEAVQWWTG